MASSIADNAAPAAVPTTFLVLESITFSPLRMIRHLNSTLFQPGFDFLQNATVATRSRFVTVQPSRPRTGICYRMQGCQKKAVPVI
ncbi:MAG: hypothetical protein AAB325_16900, partial [Pseudomonadota bacterium]